MNNNLQFSKKINKVDGNNKKNIAEYSYIKKDKNGKKKEIKFISRFISTIDTPYAKYLLK